MKIKDELIKKQDQHEEEYFSINPKPENEEIILIKVKEKRYSNCCQAPMTEDHRCSECKEGCSEEVFECECGQEITKQQNEDGGLCEQCTWLLDN